MNDELKLELGLTHYMIRHIRTWAERLDKAIAGDKDEE